MPGSTSKAHDDFAGFACQTACTACASPSGSRSIWKCNDPSSRTRSSIFLLLFVILCTAFAAPAHAFDRAAQNARYQQWLHDFHNDFHRLPPGAELQDADIERIFAKTVVPGSRAVQTIRQLATAQGDDSRSAGRRYHGARKLFLGLLGEAVAAGDGGIYPDPHPEFSTTPLRVWYLHIDGGGHMERHFSSPDFYTPYRLPPEGVLARKAYPFLLFEDGSGPLRLGSLSQEFLDLLEFLETLQYA